MTEHDPLRDRLARLDPQPASAPVDPITSPRAQDLLERTMTSDATAEPARTHRRMIVLSAAAAAALVAGGTALLAGGDDAKPPAAPAKKTTLALSLPDPLAMSSCLRFDVEILKQMPVAFAGTVTSRVGDTVSLEVTHWYKGGDAQVVTLDTPGENTSASLDNVDFAAGKDYLVTANEGTVSGCGFSGEATAELKASFDEAFG